MKDPGGYIDAKAQLLGELEGQILEQIQPVVRATITRLEQIPATATDSTAEEALGALNDELSKLISAELFLNQRPVAELASTFHPGTPGPMTSPAALMQEVLMADSPLATWFKRESPSR